MKGTVLYGPGDIRAGACRAQRAHVTPVKGKSVARLVESAAGVTLEELGATYRYGGVMFTLTMNGKPFDPDEFKKTLVAAAVKQVRDHVHEQVSAIRDPETGEFPVVQVIGTAMDDLAVRIEG
jgi:hypothetical protein